MMFDRVKNFAQRHVGAEPGPSKTTDGTAGYRSCVYYPSWSMYKGHFPDQINPQHVTNILYAFFNIVPSTGSVVLSDQWGDRDCTMDSIYTPGKKINGLLARCYEIKTRNRSLKFSMSIGGWSYSDNFKKGVDTEVKMKEFVESAVKTMIEYGFDGIDLDWEYPQDRTEGERYLQIIKYIREELCHFEQKNGLSQGSLLLSVAAPATAEHLDKLNVIQMDKYLSFWNLMTYDFAGAWSEKTGYHSNLYKTRNDELCADDTVQYFLRRGISASKLNLGIPAYGRSFVHTAGHGHSFKGVGPGSDGQEGFWSYRSLPVNGSQEQYDSKAVAAYCFDSSSKTFVSYDNEYSVAEKTRYITTNGLGGCMFWESSTDKHTPVNSSLVSVFANNVGGHLERSKNNSYVSSDYLMRNNLRIN